MLPALLVPVRIELDRCIRGSYLYLSWLGEREGKSDTERAVPALLQIGLLLLAVQTFILVG
jgi:hypothetical protein